MPLKARPQASDSAAASAHVGFLDEPQLRDGRVQCTAGKGVVTDLTEQHREILTMIGDTGAAAERLRRHGREFGQLSAAHLIVFWPERGPRPATIYGGGKASGRWYLTTAGSEALGLPPVLRLA
jgi:hypothetical protein